MTETQSIETATNTPEALGSLDALTASRPKHAAHQYLEGYCDYLQPAFLSHFEGRSFRSIFELGSRDGQDSLILHRQFGAHVHAFECNPYALELCRQRLEGVPGVTLVPLAAWHQNTRISFYPVVETYCGDTATPTRIGASSCFEADPSYHERYVQSRIEVQAVRIDDYRRERRLDPVDLVCLDVQGAALQALQGMPDTLKSCDFVLAELERRPLYQGQALLPEVTNFLAGLGFERVAAIERDPWFGDYLFERR